MIARRLPDWPERLAEYMHQHRASAFAWGSHDCVTFAAGAALAITGETVLKKKWPDAAGAARMLRKVGGLPAAVDTVLVRLPSVAKAWRGDVVLVPDPTPNSARQWLGVVDAGQWFAPGPAGLVRGPLSVASVAWGVGHG